MLQLSINAHVSLISAPRHTQVKINEFAMALGLAPIDAEGNLWCLPCANPLQRTRGKELRPVHQEHGPGDPVWVFSPQCHDDLSQA